MKRLALAALLALLIPGAEAATLKAFASEAELAALLDEWAQAHQRQRAARRAFAQEAAAPAALASKAEDSVTNTQHAGVDEGGIVKLHGEHLVILRRGRLFSVETHSLRPVDAVDAFGADVDPRGAWYDEMLVWQDTVVVIGYSYARGGTEIALFDISADGRLAYRATHHLRSNDYYSSRNYASRLIGSKLVFYTPLYLNLGRNPFESFPAMRKWGAGEFRRITPATRIYRSDEPLDPLRGVALHSVSVCDLAQRELQCEGSAVLGPAGRVFYVSPGSVFVWTANSAVFRMPLDGGAPSALKVSGTPIDQFSFLEDAGGFLNVLVRSHGRGEAMWSSERGHGRLALLRVPLASFSDGRDSAPRRAYRPLPDPGGRALQNRFVGEYLVYGSRLAYALQYKTDEGTYELPLAHGVDRIEALGEDAVVVGSDGQDLHFTSVRLGNTPQTAAHYTRPNANQGETRSHGFFYSARAGVLGLPIIGGRQRASRHLWHESASILYLNAKFQELGTLDAQPAYGVDGCRASCVDWYGNSRPLFLGRRVLALMGYEIVEGALRGQRIEELRRVNFSPAGQVRDMIAPP